MKLVEGKLKLRIAHEYPYYGTGFRTLHKVIIKNFFGWSVSLWIHHLDSATGNLSNAALLKMERIFPGYKLNEDGNTIQWKNHRYYPLDTKWIFDSKYDFRGTKNPHVFEDVNSGKYFGYSHRAVQGFGIGDMLFDPDAKINVSEYYQKPKYRRKFLWTLFKYHLCNKWRSFEDICEDNTIGHGIIQIVPFREKGARRITTFKDAFQSAANFANYVS